MTHEELFKLIDGCRERGVMQIKFTHPTGDIEFSLYPSSSAGGADPFAELSKPLDPTKCVKCQAAPQDGKLVGHCRACSLEAAGVRAS